VRKQNIIIKPSTQLIFTLMNSNLALGINARTAMIIPINVRILSNDKF